MSDIVERLNHYTFEEPLHPMLENAAAEITSLRARVAALEATLKPFAEFDTSGLPPHMRAVRVILCALGPPSPGRDEVSK
jgi:hypothetical protein